MPLWDGADPSNVGLVMAGAAAIVNGVFDTSPSCARSLRPPARPPVQGAPVADDELVLDRLVHEPGRLAILTVLSAVADADFVFLQRTTGLTKGNLSSHLAKLEDAGLVTIEKRFVRKKRHERRADHRGQAPDRPSLGAARAPQGPGGDRPAVAGGLRRAPSRGCDR